MMNQKSTVSFRETKVQMTQIVMPSDTNNHGTAFGGKIAAWCDICASVSAQRFCRTPVVTASMDSLHFLRPVKHGMVVLLNGVVSRAWRTSIEVCVRVDTEDPFTGEVANCCEAFLTFVAIDKDGKPVPVPDIDVEDDADAIRRREEAEIRRVNRLEVRTLRQQLQSRLQQ